MQEVSLNGKLHHFTGIDFWIYHKSLLEGMPPFAIGRVAYETWCLYTARLRKADLIDATKVVVSVHQNHDYSHHPQGEVGVGRGIEAQRNREMIGGKPYFFIIKDRTHVLTRKGLERPWGRLAVVAWTAPRAGVTFFRPIASEDIGESFEQHYQCGS